MDVKPNLDRVYCIENSTICKDLEFRSQSLRPQGDIL